jgi:hypothetical protein
LPTIRSERERHFPQPVSGDFREWLSDGTSTKPIYRWSFCEADYIALRDGAERAIGYIDRSEDC